MKVILDEDLAHVLRLHLPGHDVFTVAYVGWGGLRNGELLKTAEAGGFEVFVTGDQSMRYEQTSRAVSLPSLCCPLSNGESSRSTCQKSRLPLIKRRPAPLPVWSAVCS